MKADDKNRHLACCRLSICFCRIQYVLTENIKYHIVVCCFGFISETGFVRVRERE